MNPIVRHIPVGEGRLVVVDDGVDLAAAQSVRAFLDSVEVRRLHEIDLRNEFAFAHPRYDDFDVVTRVEAAAGDPVWSGIAPISGAPIPHQLTDLRDSALGALAVVAGPEAQLARSTPLTSVYVDRYDYAGSFVAHTDRYCYGPAVVGVSLGASATLEFTAPGETTVQVVVSDRSVYVMSGVIRYVPWAHAVGRVEGRRYGLTFRSAARDLRG